MSILTQSTRDVVGAFVNAFAVNDDAGNVSIIAHLPDGTNAELLPE